MKAQVFVLTLLFSGAAATSLTSQEGTTNGANPIRKVVTMLQMMMKKIEAEGEKEKELYEKFVCYCKTGGDTLSKSISDAETKITQLESDIKEAEATKVQLESDLEAHQADRAEAKQAMAKATGIREKEAAAFAAESAEEKANIAAIEAAVAALEKGMAGAFLQTNAAAVLRNLVASKVNMLDADREDLVSFLHGSQGTDSSYVPASAEIVGILKQMGDEMAKDLAEATAAE